MIRRSFFRADGVNSILFLFLFGLFFSCSNVEGIEDNAPLPEITVGKALANRAEVKLGDYASMIEYIPLENSADAQLATVDYESYPNPKGDTVPYYKMLFSVDREKAGFKNFLYSNNQLLFFHANKGTCSKQVCHLFDLKGNFIRKVEYDSSLSGLYCCVTGNYVNGDTLYTNVRVSNLNNAQEKPINKLFLYDLNTGELLKSFKHKEVNFINIGPTFNFYKTVENNVSYGVMVDENLQITGKFLICKEKPTRQTVLNEKKSIFPGKGMKIFTQSFAHKSEERLLILQESSDTICAYPFSSTKKECRPAYKLNFADTLSAVMRDIKIDVLNFAESEDMIFMQVKENKDYPFGGEWMQLDMETKNVPYYKLSAEVYNDQVYKGKEAACYILYNKITGETLSPSAGNPVWMGGMTNDIDNGAPFWPSHINGNKMFKLTDAEEFVELAALSNSARMKEVASKLNSESNPVLVVVTLK